MRGQIYANAKYPSAKNSSSVGVTLSNAVKKLQQNLSNQYGIPTFTTTGALSTIPTDLKFSNIFEGFGQYGDASSFKQAVVDLVTKNPSKYNVSIQTDTSGNSSVTIPDPTQPQRTFNVNDASTSKFIETTGQSNFSNQISGFVSKNKTLVLGAAALVVILVVFGGRKR